MIVLNVLKILLLIMVSILIGMELGGNNPRKEKLEIIVFMILFIIIGYVLNLTI